MDLRDYLHVFRRRWRWVALGLIATVALAEAYLLQATPQYESRTQVFISTQSSDSNDAYQGSLFSSQRVASYADLATAPDLAQAVIDRLDLDMSASTLASKVSAQAKPQTVLLSLTVRDPDPAQAQRIARAYAVELSRLVAELETPPGKDSPVLKATTVRSAGLPTSPASPDDTRILMLGAVLGLLLGFGLAALRELLDTSLKTADDIEAITPAPVLGRINNDAIVAKEPLISTMSPHHPRVESFRVIRTNLQFVDVDADHKAFVISSAMPGEGKSSTAINVALTLAMAGKKVLLVDADLRRPRAGALLGVDTAVGLTTVLVGQLSVTDAIQHHDSGLHVMASGAVPPNPAELLQSQAMTDVLAELRTSYDVVIFDAPPLLPVTDAAILASKTDGAILVVRHGKTTKDQVRGACDRLTQVDASPLGVVLNRVPAKGGGSGYGYGYGYGYAPETPEAGKRRGGKPPKEKAPKAPKAPKPVKAPKSKSTKAKGAVVEAAPEADPGTRPTMSDASDER